MTDILRPEEVASQLKSNRDFYEEAMKGIGTIYSNPDQDKLLREKCKETVDLIDSFLEEYKERYSHVSTKRVSKVNPKCVDLNFAHFISDYFEVEVPESGKYAVLDIHKVGHKALSVYTREKDLKNKQFFLLDDTLKALVNAPSLSDSSKTFLQLTQERIDELNKDRDKISASCSNIIYQGSDIYMNISATKILVPLFSLDYSPADSDKYVPYIQTVIDVVSERYNKLVEDEK